MSYDDTAAYTPFASRYEDGADTSRAQLMRAPRRGPLSSRLEARARLTPLPESAPLVDPDDAPDPADAEVFAPNASSEYRPGGVSAAQAGPAWALLTEVLRQPGEAAEALRESADFGARWTSRSDMLSACLDEYYRLTAKYNEALALLKAVEQDLPPLRQQQATAYMTLREMETRLELHSRAELRAAYLGAAENEMRSFRVEQERDQLHHRVETLEGFLGFLSRVIATIRSIPAEALAQPELARDVELVSPPSSVSGPLADEDDADAASYEEIEVDADEAAILAARGEVEVLGAVEEVESATDAQTSIPISTDSMYQAPSPDGVAL